ncbi:hypothetical protein AYO20_09678 [Fonsecaea nubica]|uniref:Uncharacterized protein n=1 Tax=Fonsecaea nubica TaxID=856822 RepID=A0A178CFJ9_9EURO|nr:hypothetical protein AYO20_09678 [Fonsecaea nubica]OAL27825.1 hypothetical protein AYO20_09678 [Fonsecaea nubica]
MATEQLTFDGQATIVTGAAGGMGYYHATVLAQRGATPAIVGINPDAAKAAVAKNCILQRQGYQFRCGRLIGVSLHRYRGKVLETFQDISETDIARIIGVHFNSAWTLCQAV